VIWGDYFFSIILSCVVTEVGNVLSSCYCKSFVKYENHMGGLAINFCSYQVHVDPLALDT